MPGIFITATDTEVGKTAVACALILALRRRGLDVGVMKPVATGCTDGSGRLHLADAERLRAAAGCDDDLAWICPVALPEPLSPHVAAERAGLKIDRDTIGLAYTEIAARHPFVIVEGVGGLLTPITPDWLLADVAADMRLPLVIVTRWGLGTLNHTLLTISEARRRSLPIAGLVLNEVAIRPHGVAEQTAPNELKRLTGETIVAQIPFCPADHPADLAEKMALHISGPALEHILDAAGASVGRRNAADERTGEPESIFGVDGPLPDAPDPDAVPT